MRRLPEIVALYGETDAFLKELRIAAHEAGDRARSSVLRAKQIINDHAYFLLCWGQLEVWINDVCRSAIREGRKAKHWTVRRAWYLYDPDDRRLSGLRFRDRLSLVLDRQGGRESPFARAMHYYEVRNQIAHGAVLSDRIDVSEAVRDFYLIQSHLQP